MDRMLCASRTYEEELRLAKEAAAASTSSSAVASAAAGVRTAGAAAAAEKDKSDDMPTHAAQIELDLQRTFPNHVDFRMEGKGGPGGNGSKLEPLRRILLALAHAHAEVGEVACFHTKQRVTVLFPRLLLVSRLQSAKMSNVRVETIPRRRTAPVPRLVTRRG